MDLIFSKTKHSNKKMLKFSSVAGGVEQRLEKSIETQKNNRASTKDTLRNLPINKSQLSEVPIKLEQRLHNLQKWKEDKDKKKKEGVKITKPPFVVGVPHCSLNYIPPPPVKSKSLPSSSGFTGRKVTKSNEVNRTTSFALKSATFKAPQIKKSEKLPVFAKHNPLLKHKQDKKNNIEVSFKPVFPSKSHNARSNTLKHDNDNKPKGAVPIQTPTIANEVLITPEQIVEESKSVSPCDTLSRGKDNARKEMNKKVDEGLLDENKSGTVESVEHFRRLLNAEITRLTEMCEQWDKISEQTVLPDPVLELVLAAVGQARLLMSSKFQQFASLVEQCAAPDPNSRLVRPADLRGLWDVVFMQVENIEMQFKNLEGLRSRNWVEEQVRSIVKKPKLKTDVKLNKDVKPSRSSRSKAFIEACRRAKQSNPPSAAADASNKTFDGGFFSVETPRRLPAVSTTLKSTHRAEPSTVIKASSNKFQRALLTIMRASICGKCVDEPSPPSF